MNDDGMRVYILERTGCIEQDEMSSIIVRAENEEDARRNASKHSGAEGPEPWLRGHEDGGPVTCELVTHETAFGVIRRTLKNR